MFAYRASDLLVVTSRQEAMSIVALEAGICGKCVLLTDQCGFDEIKNVDAHLEVPATVQGLVIGLKYLLCPTTDIVRIGLDLEQYISDKYLWEVLIHQYIEYYKELIS